MLGFGVSKSCHEDNNGHKLKIWTHFLDVLDVNKTNVWHAAERVLNANASVARWLLSAPFLQAIRSRAFERRTLSIRLWQNCQLQRFCLSSSATADCAFVTRPPAT
jgi:hypothetical protein